LKGRIDDGHNDLGIFNFGNGDFFFDSSDNPLADTVFEEQENGAENSRDRTSLA
jgi:hypothetical protein